MTGAARQGLDTVSGVIYAPAEINGVLHQGREHGEHLVGGRGAVRVRVSRGNDIGPADPRRQHLAGTILDVAEPILVDPVRAGLEGDEFGREPVGADDLGDGLRLRRQRLPGPALPVELCRLRIGAGVAGEQFPCRAAPEPPLEPAGARVALWRRVGQAGPLHHDGRSSYTSSPRSTLVSVSTSHRS